MRPNSPGATVFIAALVLVSAACSPEKKAQQEDPGAIPEAHAFHDHHVADPRVAGVMASHDSIMPGMSEIVQLSRLVSRRIKKTDSLMMKGTNDALLPERKSAEAILRQLADADDAMMTWMHEYKPDSLARLSDSEAKEYISDLTTGIDEVKKKIERSIQDAEAFLKQ